MINNFCNFAQRNEFAAFGYSPSKVKETKVIITTTTIVGYIPILGTISGLFRLAVSYVGKAKTDADKKAFMSHRIRGTIELIPLAGTSLILVDLIFWAARQRLLP